MQHKLNHSYRLDVPHYFATEDDTIKDHYKVAISERIEQGRTDVFCHLQCIDCPAEAHIYIDIDLVERIINEDTPNRFHYRWVKSREIN